MNPKVLKIQAHWEILGPTRNKVIQITDEESEELEKSLQEDTRVANDENEQPSVRERAPERIRENTERKPSLNRRENSLWRSYPFGSG